MADYEPQRSGWIGRADGQLLLALQHRLQQRTSIRVDDGGAPARNPVPLIERGLPALAALCLHDRMSKFDLTHFQDGGAGGVERRPRGKAEGETEAIRRAGHGRDARHLDIRRNVE
jgi:hypothetical protein